MWIKILLLVAVIAVALLLTRASADARHQALRRLLLAGFILAAVASVMFPQVLTTVANWVGVGRGADLLLYGLVIAFLSYVSTTHRRMNRMARELTILAREITLLNAEKTNVVNDLHNSSTSLPQPLPPSQPFTAYDSERD